MSPFIAWKLICLLSVVPVHLLGLKDEERLGDSVISERASKAFFDKLDNNDNGMLSVEEFRQFIKDTGGNALDESSEIQSAVANVMISLDDNEDKVVKKKDLAAFWMHQASLLSVKEAADWAKHSMHMPDDVVEIFLRNAVTGYDFPELIENEGELIETELGITRKNLKRRLLRGMIMRFTAMGSMPDTPSSFDVKPAGCLEVKLSWDKFRTSDVYFPVHKYVVERFEPDEKGEHSSSSPGARWTSIYTGTGTEAIDNVLLKEDVTSELLVYRISAWNAIGRSDYAEKKVTLSYENIHCETHRRSEALPLDYLVGSHGGTIKAVPPVSPPWIDGPWFYFGLLPGLLAIITAVGFYFSSLIEEEEDCDEKSAFRSIVFKARRLIRKAPRNKPIRNAEIQPTVPPSLSPHCSDSAGSPVSGYDSDSISADIHVDSMSEISSMTSGSDLTGATLHSKSSKWNLLRARVKNKSFSKMFSTGRNGTPPIPVMSPIDENHSCKSAGIAVAARVTTAAAGGLSTEDIFGDSSLACNDDHLPKPVRTKAISSSGDANLNALPAALPRARSFGDNITDPASESPKSSSNTSSIFKNKGHTSSSGSCDNLPGLIDGRISPTTREKGKYCMQCHRSFSFGKRMKHRCGKCNESFCGECASKIAHVFALPCKVPSQCICKKCGC